MDVVGEVDMDVADSIAHASNSACTARTVSSDLFLPP